ncbi:MAG TPA: ABC transporter ATP-binding protein [Thermoanaerobaculia bacterium]|nr:ABC transporter ATP-binding protein [Thermoanaerobaculia bacterium]
MSASDATPQPDRVLLRAEGVCRVFRSRGGGARRVVRAVSDVDLELLAGESFALVGESGSGKTTLARVLLRLIEPSAGRVWFDGRELTALSRRELRRARRGFQMVFQDPAGSLDPRMSVGRAVAEPLRIHRLAPRGERGERVSRLLEMVGLPEEVARRPPAELSGGQRQRVAIARALATEPKLLVADEPVSSLDVSVRAQVVNLLARLQIELGLSLLFIGHDLATVEQLADRVAVMYLGRLVEIAPAARLFAEPAHPYSVALLAAAPRPEPGRARRRLVALAGEPPDPAAPPTGCAFHPRCPLATERCVSERPALRELVPGHRVACHYPGELRPGYGAERDNLSPEHA